MSIFKHRGMSDAAEWIETRGWLDDPEKPFSRVGELLDFNPGDESLQINAVDADLIVNTPDLGPLFTEACNAYPGIMFEGDVLTNEGEDWLEGFYDGLQKAWNLMQKAV